jgi:hypothetical protein
MRSEKVPVHPTGYSPVVADEHGRWTRLSVHDLVELLGGAPFPWWVAGRHAIDLFVGRETRPHADTDVQVLRRDQLAVQARRAGWDLHAADPPGALRPWARGEVLQPAVHDLWCRRAPDAPWALQLIARRGRRRALDLPARPRISCPFERFGRRSADGVPDVAPEVQLLFKARALLPKDEADFAVALPLLNPKPAVGSPTRSRWTLRSTHGWAGYGLRPTLIPTGSLARPPPFKRTADPRSGRSARGCARRPARRAASGDRGPSTRPAATRPRE